MDRHVRAVVMAVAWASPAAVALAEEARSQWSVDVGVRWFKHSASGQPNEIGPDQVFDRWEDINQRPDVYAVSDYAPLEPLYFNMNFGVDAFLRYRRHLLVKIGYDYSNPFGIGGSGQIAYTDLRTGAEHEESKEFSYTSHQLSTFFGPLVPVAGDKAEIYLGFSPMAPTWVRYHEEGRHVESGVEVESYDRTYTGFFGSCRALVGIQVRVTERVKIGTEAVFAFLNYMKLKSGDLEDNSFRFPSMNWNVTARYELF